MSKKVRYLKIVPLLLVVMLFLMFVSSYEAKFYTEINDKEIKIHKNYETDNDLRLEIQKGSAVYSHQGTPSFPVIFNAPSFGEYIITIKENKEEIFYEEIYLKETKKTCKDLSVELSSETIFLGEEIVIKVDNYEKDFSLRILHDGKVYTFSKKETAASFKPQSKGLYKVNVICENEVFDKNFEVLDSVELDEVNKTVKERLEDVKISEKSKIVLSNVYGEEKVYFEAVVFDEEYLELKKELELLKDSSGEVQVMQSGRSVEDITGLLNEKYRRGLPVRLLFDDLPVRNIDFKDLNIENHEISLGIKELEDFGVQSFAIDPENLEFSTANVTVSAKGNILYKCEDWDFLTDTCAPRQTACTDEPKATRSCNTTGGWTKIKHISPGQNYTFTITPDDPGFVEFSSEFGAPYCGVSGESPCVVNSSLLASRNSLATPEPNEPNTIDTCLDGTSGAYLDDESVENVTITSLDDDVFRQGDLVEVRAWVHCWGDVSDDNINFVYTNSTSDINWRVMDYYEECPGGGLQEVVGVFSLDDVPGNHSVRVSIQYQGSITDTCGTSAWDDNDDVVFSVLEAETTEEIVSSKRKIKIFNETGVHEWSIPPGVENVEVLVVGGGGGGGSSTSFGNAGAGGGGAGGLIHNESYDVSGYSDFVEIVVGSGGSGGPTGNNPGISGEDSSFGSLVAFGGGGGSGGNMQGLSGGSGGGSRGSDGGEATQPSSVSGGHGFRGGNSGGSGEGAAATGGGGAGGPGEDLAGSNGEKGGDGGIGLSINISGTPTYYAGGGGGGAAMTNTPVGSGGLGGGGSGGNNDISPSPGLNGTGGGGGGGNNNLVGARGGDGVVIISWECKGNISFESPTPVNDSNVPVNSDVLFNVSLSTSNLTDFSFTWDESTYTFYDDSLVLMYGLDNLSSIGENSFVVRDTSLNNYDGSVSGATWTPNGRYGGAYEFDGSSEIVSSYQPSASELSGGGALEAWVYWNSDSGDHFFGSWDAPRFYIGNRGGTLQTGFGSDWNNPSVDFEMNTWHHVVLTNDGSTTRVYIDGVLVDSYSSTFSGTNSNFFTLGQVQGEERFMNGLLDEVRIYNKNLDEDKVRELYSSNFRKVDSEKWIFSRVEREIAEGTYYYNASAINEEGILFETEVRALNAVGIPIMTESRLYPSPMSDTSLDLQGFCEAEYSGAGDIEYYYRLYRNNVLFESDKTSEKSPGVEVNVANVSFEDTSLGDEWLISCLATNGIYNSSWLNSSVTSITESYNFLNFVPPTPDNNVQTFFNDVLVNVSVDSVDLTDFVWNWQGEDYSIFDDSLVAMYNFDDEEVLGESIDNVRDMSLYGNNLNISNSVSWVSDGRFGGAYDFDGGYFSMPATDSLNLRENMTFMGWVYFDGNPGFSYLLSKNTGATSDMQYGVLFRSPQTGDNWGVYLGGTRIDLSDRSWPMQEWVHVAVTYDGSTVRGFVNGEFDSSASYTSSIGDVGNWFSVGRRSSNTAGTSSSGEFEGMIDEVRMWNRTLSEEEIVAMYNSNLKRVDEENWLFESSHPNLDLGTYEYSAFTRNLFGLENQSITRFFEIVSLYPVFETFDGDTTDFESFSQEELDSLSNVVLEKELFGRIVWYDDLDVRGLNFDDNVFIEDNLIGINPDNLHESLNSTADIIFYDLPWEEPVVLKNGEVCGEAVCQINSYSGGTLNVTVSSFSNYTTTETTREVNISFVDPTFEDEARPEENDVPINISIFDSALKSLDLEWDGFNYSFYDESLILMLNLDNNSALGESDGVAVDSSIYGNNASIQGGVWSEGRFNGGLSFESGQLAEIPSSPSLESSDTHFTVSAWGYARSLPPDGADHVPIVWRGSQIGWGNNYHFRIALRSSGVVTWGATSSSEHWFDGGVVSAGSWHHYTFVADGDTLIAYIDGEQVGTSSGGAPYNTAGFSTWLGEAVADGGNDVYFDGIVDEVRFFNRSLSEEEIQFMYGSNLRRITSTSWNLFSFLEDLDDGTYEYQGFASNFDDENGSTDRRTVILGSALPTISNISCLRDGSWTSCINVGYGDSVSGVRARCVSNAGPGIENVSFSWRNTYKDKLFFNGTASSQSGSFWVETFDPITIYDSGDYELNVSCYEDDVFNSERQVLWEVPFGVLVPTLIEPEEDIFVTQNSTVNFTGSVECTIGECGDVTGSLIYFGGVDVLTQNPVTFEEDECYRNMSLGDTCVNTWVVNATGEPDTSWELFVSYEPLNFTDRISVANTSLVNITIRDNTPPEMDFVNLAPAFPTAEDDLVCSFSAFDADGDDVFVNITWYRNNVFYSSDQYALNNFVNESVMPFENTALGETWLCEATPFDGQDYGESVNSSLVEVLVSRPPVIHDVECLVNEGSWMSCGDIGYGDTLNNVRVNCTDPDGFVENVIVSLRNVDQGLFYFSESAFFNNGFWEANNDDVSIFDSGNFELEVFCEDDSDINSTEVISWFVPWGNLEVELLNPNQDIFVAHNHYFNFTSSISCVGGQCGNVTFALDPENWWNNSWYYRSNFNLTENTGSDVEGVQVLLDLNTEDLIDDNKLNEDCSDLRFVDSDVNELPYWLEGGCGTGSTLVWLKADLSGGEINEFFMYYGNPEADSGSDGISTFVSFGDFSGSDLHEDWNYTVVDSGGGTEGSVSVNNNELTIMNNFGDDVWTTSYEATVAFQDLKVDGDFEAVARILSQTNTDPWAKSGIFVQNNVEEGVSDGKANIVVTPGNGVAFQWQESGGSNIAPDENSAGGSYSFPTYLRLVKTDNEVSGFYSSDGDSWSQQGSGVTPLGIESEQYVTLFHTTHNSSNSPGSAVFDLFYVRKLISDDPSVSGFSEEEAGGGSKNIIPMNEGFPFYTISQNPVGFEHDSCFENMLSGDSCDFTWTVNATGGIGTFWEFFTIGNSTFGNVLDVQSETIMIGIIDEQLIPPVVTLISPSADYHSNLLDINFVCDVSDNIGLENITLYGNFSGTYEAVETLDSGGLFDTGSFDYSFSDEEKYVWNCVAEDVNGNIGMSSNNRTLYIDQTPPSVELVSPVNESEVTDSFVNLTFVATDNLADELSCDVNLNGDVVETVLVESGETVGVESVFVSGENAWNVTCSDKADNTNTSETWIFFGIGVDLSVSDSEIYFSDESPKEGDFMSITATIRNVGINDVDSVLVQFWENEIEGEGVQLSSDELISLDAGDYVNLSKDFTANIGTTEYIIVIDPYDEIFEIDKDNNVASRNLTVLFWHFVTGITNDSLIITDASQGLLFDWSLADTSGSNIFVADFDSSVSWNSLQSLGRDINNNVAFEDFAILDDALGSASYSDSINATYTSGGNPVSTMAFEIFGTLLSNVPVVNSVESSNFRTGILWDTSEGGITFDGTQDVVFVTTINKGLTGSSGDPADFEIRIPATLREYTSSDNEKVAFYTELK